MNSRADHVFNASRSSPSTIAGGGRNNSSTSSSKRRKSSARGYALGVCALACFLFVALWWLLHNEKGQPESGAVPAAMSAAIVLLIGFVARDHLLGQASNKRRSLAHYDAGVSRSTLAQREQQQRRHPEGSVGHKVAALNALERKLAELNLKANSPEQHLDAYRLCEEYVVAVSDSLAAAAVANNTRNSLRARQERVRAIQRQHLLSWARESSQKLVYQAQRRARVSAKIETALKASEIIEMALRVYPEERQLHESISAIGDYIASVRVEYWMELAERAFLKSHYQKAVDRYQNALFYLDRDKAWGKWRAETEEQIQRQIQSLYNIISLSGEAEELSPPSAD